METPIPIPPSHCRTHPICRARSCKSEARSCRVLESSGCVVRKHGKQGHSTEWREGWFLTCFGGNSSHHRQSKSRYISSPPTSCRRTDVTGRWHGAGRVCCAIRLSAHPPHRVYSLVALRTI